VSRTARPSPAQWLEGARPRTLPAAAAPVIAASGLAAWVGDFSPVRALLALVVALALQVGVNYANDYSDGIRGTDAERVGPMRLVGSGVARPATVKRAAFAGFGLAALAGLGLVLLTGQWWLLAVGAGCVVAAWYYTGGKNPYGYRGLGEVFVFVFFGLVAVCGTYYVQVGRVSLAALLSGAWVGALACAILVANNLRDLDGDRAVGKRTLATRLGDRGTRILYVSLVRGSALLVVVVALLTSGWALTGLAGLVLLLPASRRVLQGASRGDLVGVLKATGLAELAAAVGFALGLTLSAAGLV
jgi:1,4-dihydroxy-2-naphthoate octaprenyltransferase